MGIHPLITALESGAQYILAGRSCDIALFASDMIRRGIDAGLAYHVGHVLECGALACDPGSPSDCLVAEIYDDGSAIFTAPNPTRRCTAYSIAAHSLYEESHPQLQFYPEGILVMEKTQFFSRDGRTAGIRNSRFVRSAKPWPWSIKLEGSRRLGARKVSLIHIDPADLPKIPADVLVYGRNGVQAQPVEGAQRELGIIVETTAKTRGGRGSAGEPADALSHPLRLSRPQGDRRQHRLSAVAQPRQLQRAMTACSAPSCRAARAIPCSSKTMPKIKAAVLKLIADEFPDALAECHLHDHRRRRLEPGGAAAHRRSRPEAACRSATSRRSTGSRGWPSPAPARGSISTRRTPMPGRSIICCRTRT